MEYKGVNFIHPDWSMWEQFLYDDRSTYVIIVFDLSWSHIFLGRTIAQPNHLTA
jgi:hypothetical protein